MTVMTEPLPLLQRLNKAGYNIRSLDDEIRVDKLCIDLLRRLNQELTRQSGKASEQAGEICHGADYFLREFIIGECCENLFAIEAIRVRQFAGHWYIIRTTEPNLKELKSILSGTEEIYRILLRQCLISDVSANKITSQCQELDYYQQRIEEFWAIEGDGYDAWRQACPLQSIPEQS